MQIDHLKYELSKMNDMYNNKCRECENLAVQRANSEQQLRKTLEENDLLIQRLNAFEKEKV